LEDAEFVCECANDKCINRLPLSLDDYHDVRKVPTHFVDKPGHVFHEFERVICAHVRRPDPPHEHGADRRVERGRTAGPVWLAHIGIDRALGIRSAISERVQRTLLRRI